MSDPPFHRRSITDSPWFWVYLFSTFGLTLLVLWQPKFQQRQAQIERQYQGRQRAAERQAGREPTTPVSTSENTIIRLQPLYLVLGVMLVVAWVHLWWNHFRRRVQPETATKQKVKS